MGNMRNREADGRYSGGWCSHKISIMNVLQGYITAIEIPEMKKSGYPQGVNLRHFGALLP
jgi:hypothetical protein